MFKKCEIWSVHYTRRIDCSCCNFMIWFNFNWSHTHFYCSSSGGNAVTATSIEAVGGSMLLDNWPRAHFNWPAFNFNAVATTAMQLPQRQFQWPQRHLQFARRHLQLMQFYNENVKYLVLRYRWVCDWLLILSSRLSLWFLSTSECCGGHKWSSHSIFHYKAAIHKNILPSIGNHNFLIRYKAGSSWLCWYDPLFNSAANDIHLKPLHIGKMFGSPTSLSDMCKSFWRQQNESNVYTLSSCYQL